MKKFNSEAQQKHQQIAEETERVIHENKLLKKKIY